MIISKDWDFLLKDVIADSSFQAMLAKINEERKTYKIFPKEEDVFKAFKLTPYKNIKCVIIGQDPYHRINQANGLAFSVNNNIKIPPSLKNIYKELFNDLKINIPNHGNLTNWAKEGVLLLNTTLTVREGLANSHKTYGWDYFTNNVIKIINNKEQPVVFILWGNNAQSLSAFITNKRHSILKGSHPSTISFSFSWKKISIKDSY